MAEEIGLPGRLEIDKVRLDMQSRDLPHEAQLALFRIAQEALGNIRKYAEASKVVIRLESGAGK